MVRFPHSRPSMGRLFDISETGLSFLYNGKLEVGHRLPGVISLKYLVENPFKVEDISFDLEIVWAKKSPHAAFRYAYGTKFDPAKTKFDAATRAKVIHFIEEKISESKEE